jgi:hypothetical protein
VNYFDIITYLYRKIIMATETPTPTPTVTPTVTVTPSVTTTVTPTPSITPTKTPTPSVTTTVTPTVTTTTTPTPTKTPTPTPTPSNFPTEAPVSIYNQPIVGYVPGTGNTVGDIVTFDTNNPIWMGNQRGLAPQPGAITLGGFNGLNS